MQKWDLDMLKWDSDVAELEFGRCCIGTCCELGHVAKWDLDMPN